MSTHNDTNTEDGEQAMACGLRRGDRAVVADFYNRHAAYLAGVCSRYITNTDDAEDVFHDAMLKIVQKASSFEYRGPGSLRSWAARITANEAVTFLRKNNWGLTDIDNLPDTPDEPEPDVSDITPETIHGLIRKLPDGYRTVFNLYAIDGKSHREIATMLGIKEASSASQYHRARNMLANMINDYRKRQQH